MEYTYIFVAEYTNESLSAFRADGASCINRGDLIESQGDIFKITEIAYVQVDGDAYRAIEALGPILTADKIYSLAWENKEVK